MYLRDAKEAETHSPPLGQFKPDIKPKKVTHEKRKKEKERKEKEREKEKGKGHGSCHTVNGLQAPSQ